MPGLTAMYGLSREVKSRADKLGEASATDASVKEQRTNNIISIEMVRQLRSINNNVLQQTRISALQANNAKQTAMFAEEAEREKTQRDKELLDAIKSLKGGGGAGKALGSAGGAAGGKGFLGTLFDVLQNASLLEALGIGLGGKAILDKGKTIFRKGAGKVPTPTTGGTPPTGGGGKVIPFPPGGRGGPPIPPTGGGGFGAGGGLLRGAGLAASGLLRILSGPIGWTLLGAQIAYEAYKIFGAQGGQGGKNPNFGGVGSSVMPGVEGPGGAVFGMYSRPGTPVRGSFSQAKDSQAANVYQSSQRVVKGMYGVSAPGRFTSSDAPTKQLPPNAPNPVSSPASSDVGSTAKFITGKEDFRGLAYDDGGRFAIGYGHNITDAEIKSGQIDLGNGEFIKVSGDRGRTTTATREQANKLYSKDIAKFERVVIRAIGQEAYDKLSQNQKTAILSYAYNTGKVPDGFAKAIKDGNLAQAAASIRNGIATAKGVPVRGLKIRREEEARLFDTAGPATSEERKAGVFTKAGGPGAPITPAGGDGGKEMQLQNSIGGGDYRPTGSGSRLVAPNVGPVQTNDEQANKTLKKSLEIYKAGAKAAGVAPGGKSVSARAVETQVKETKDRKYIREANQTFLNQFQSTTQRLLSETLYKAIVVGAYGKEGSRNLVSKQEASGEGYRGGQLSNLLKLPSKTEKILTSAFGKKIGQAYAPMLSQLGTAYLEVGARQAGRGLFKGLFGTDDAAADSLTGQILGNFAKGNKQAATEQLLYGLTGVASGPETIFAKYGFNSSQQGTNFLGGYGAAQITAPLANMMGGKQPTYTGPYGQGTYGAGQTPMIQPMQPANQRGAYYTATTATGQEKTFVNPAHMQAALAGDQAAQKELPHIADGTWENLKQLKVAEKVATEQYLKAEAGSSEYRIAQEAREQAQIRLQEESNKIAQSKPAGGGSSAGGNFMSNMGNFAFDLGTSLVANKLTQNIKNPYLKAFANYGITSAANQFIGKAIFGGSTAAGAAGTAAAPGFFSAGGGGSQLASSLMPSSTLGFAGTAGNMLASSGYTTAGNFFSGVQSGMNISSGAASSGYASAGMGGDLVAGEMVGQALPYTQAIILALKGDLKKAATSAAGTYIGLAISGGNPIVGAIGGYLGSLIGRKKKPAILRITSTTGNEVSAVTGWEKDKPPEAFSKFADLLLVALLNSAKLMQQQSGVALPFAHIGVYVDSVSGVSLCLFQEGESTNNWALPKWSKNFGSVKDFKIGTGIVGMIEFMRDCLKEGKDTITADKLDKATADLKSKDIQAITSGVLTELKPGGQYDLAKGVGYNSGKPTTTGFTVAKIGRYDSANTAASTTTTGTPPPAAGTPAITPGGTPPPAAGTPAITPGGTTTPAANLTTSADQKTLNNNSAPVNSVVAVGGKTENDNSTTITNINQMSITADPWRQTAFNTGYQMYA
jgi:GH24 family phage-related lysozyme (muramidase)